MTSQPSCCRPALRALLLAATTAAPAGAQNGFEWDYPDGLGVRYLLYDRAERSAFEANDRPAELRALFRPKSKADWVRIKGTELAWGMQVYEFRGEDGGFERFLKERDPRRTFREFRVDGEPVKGHQGRRWEYVDTWRPLLEMLDRPQPRGPYRYAVAPELGLRLLADKTMDYADPFTKTDGDNCFARLHPAPAKWLRIEGVPGPVAWMLRLYVFPDLQRLHSSSDREHLVESFAAFAGGRDPQRRYYDRHIEVRDETGEGPGLPYRLWRWTDTRRKARAKTTRYFFAVAAAYDVGGREVVLVGTAPADDPNEQPKEMQALQKMVTSLEPWSAKARAPGFSFYNLAASCRVGDREVGVVVYLPVGPDPRPRGKMLQVARRIVQSLQPSDARKR